MSQSLVSKELASLASQSIFQGSKSFSLASLFFSKTERSAVHLLYAWCRFTDDQIDQCDPADKAKQMEILHWLKAETSKAFQGQATGHPIFLGLQAVALKYRIPALYAEELLNGYEMDIRKNRYATAQELDLYCYRVAGVVGLMMCHIMGISDVRALEQANMMGMAMQMTNIARDVQADFLMGRVYLPQEWLKPVGIDDRSLLDVAQEVRLHSVVVQLVQRAESFYSRADHGLRALPWRAALAVAGARWIYSEIGRQVVQSGPLSLRQRTIVPLRIKLVLLTKGLLTVLRQMPSRWKSPFKSVEISQTLRLS